MSAPAVQVAKFVRRLGSDRDGEVVAAVVDKTRYLAEDAADLIELDLDEQKPVLDPELSLARGCDRLFVDVVGNLALEGHYGSKEDPGALFENAALVMRRRYRMNRSGNPPLEALGVVAKYENLRLTVWSTIQRPQMLRIAVPGINNVWQTTIKDTALVSVVGLQELMRISYIGANSTRHPFVFYLIAAVVYLIITLVSQAVFDGVERLLRINLLGRRRGGAAPRNVCGINRCVARVSTVVRAFRAQREACHRSIAAHTRRDDLVPRRAQS